MLKEKWQAYYDKMMEIAELYRSGAHANTSAYVSLFKEAKVRWLFFMNSAVAKQYDEKEVVELMEMGLVQRDIPEGAQGDNQKHTEVPFWYYLGEA